MLSDISVVPTLQVHVLKFKGGTGYSGTVIMLSLMKIHQMVKKLLGRTDIWMDRHRHYILKAYFPYK
jgi:hypothetical protein